MEEKILRIVYDYSIKGKLADIDFIYKVIQVVIDGKELSNYLEDVRLIQKVVSDNKGKIKLATYDSDFKTIRIYVEAIDNLIKYNNKYKEYLSHEEDIFYKNLLFVHIILHELEHANQQKIILEQKGIEADILKLRYKNSSVIVDDEMVRKMKKLGLSMNSFAAYALGAQKKYEESYEFAPEERLAEIKSYKQIINIIRPISKKLTRLSTIEEIKLLSSYLRGYEQTEISSPTIKYFTNCGQVGGLKRFNWYNDDNQICLNKCSSIYSLHDKMLYGLPISEYEYNSVEKNIQYKYSKLK